MDPFSITTGAAGFVSLGITVCEGLITYCRAYKSRDDDILLLNQHSERLQKFLALTQVRLQPGGLPVNSEVKDAIQNSIDACGACLQELERLSAKYPPRSQIPGGLKDRGKAVVNHDRYPFQKENFDTFRGQLNELQSAMCSYLLLLNK